MSLSNTDQLRLVLALALLVLAAHGVGHAFARLRQPRVIGEILGGLLLGPTVLGVAAPGAQHWVFPSHGTNASILGAVQQLGLLLLMYCAGLETRAVFRRGDERAVSLITMTGTVLPFVLGLLLVQFVDTGPLTGPAHSRVAIALVFALAIAVTSVPVISRIMFDLGILHTGFARIVLGVAIVEDTIVYIVLAIVLGLVAAPHTHELGVAAAVGFAPGSVPFLVLHTVTTVAFFAVVLGLGGRLLRRLSSSRLNFVGSGNPTGFQLLFLLAVTGVCIALGVTAMFGAFLAGIVASSVEGRGGAAARGAIKDFSLAFFVPVYFATVGLQLDLVHHFQPVFFLWFTAFACVIKTSSVYLGARLAREQPRTAINLAVAMNARGGPGIVLASVAYATGIVNQDFFVALVLLVMVTSQAAGAWLGRVCRSPGELRAEPTAHAVAAPAS